MFTSVSRAELTPVSFLRRAASLFPDRTAVVHGERRCSYAELERRVHRLVHGLRTLGVQRGDRVALLSPNTPAMLEATLAVPMTGAVIVAVNTRLAPPEVAHIVADSGARLLLVDAELEAQAQDVPDAVERLVIADTGEAGDPYEDLLATASAEPVEFEPADEEDLLALNYTSGTTGEPKGAMYTHRGAYLAALGNAMETGLRYGSVYLWTLPMFHCSGWCFPWAVTATAGTHVCLRRVDPEEIWRLLDAEGVTHYCCAPTVQISVVNHAAATKLPRPVRVVMGGAGPSPALIAQMYDLGFEPLHLYGLTEVYGPHAVCVWHSEWDELPLEDQARLRARQGQVLMAPDRLRVVDADLRDVPADGETMGEVVMRGNGVMTGYYGQAERTEESFRGGWFHSGDLAVMHPDGYIELQDRQKDVIISGGENISTIEVEQALSAHPAVLEAAVVATPDERWGERPKAFVALRDGQQVDEPELIDFCRQRIARFKAPAVVEFGELPKTSTGKVQKYVLREREWEGHDKRVN